MQTLLEAVNDYVGMTRFGIFVTTFVVLFVTLYFCEQIRNHD